ncbi:MAG: hypothetical protein QM532_01755 [Cyanobium sp. MAG06]|nr:hypothetical protein [Cyanobium sp. MAG06]
MLELEKLFGSQDKVRLLRLLLANRDKFYELDEIKDKIFVDKDILKKLLDQLEKGNIIKKTKKKFAKTIEYPNKKVRNIPIKEYFCYEINKDFRYIESLSELLFDMVSVDREELLSKFKNIGKIKLFVVSGVFTNEPKSRADILFVGETINKKMIDDILSQINADYGIDIKVVFYDLEEFEYRVKMFDKFVKDIFRYKHEIVINNTKIL